jgi:hypothetical protein
VRKQAKQLTNYATTCVGTEGPPELVLSLDSRRSVHVPGLTGHADATTSVHEATRIRFSISDASWEAVDGAPMLREVPLQVRESRA